MHPVNWVTIKKFSELTGYTEDAVRAKLANGVWLESALWKKAPDGRILMNLPGYNDWVEGTPQHLAIASSVRRNSTAL